MIIERTSDVKAQSMSFDMRCLRLHHVFPLTDLKAGSVLNGCRDWP